MLLVYYNSIKSCNLRFYSAGRYPAAVGSFVQNVRIRFWEQERKNAIRCHEHGHSVEGSFFKIVKWPSKKQFQRQRALYLHFWNNRSPQSCNLFVLVHLKIKNELIPL